MTPEELNRTVEFIVQSQARLAAAQEQDREERIEFQKWSKDLNRKVLDLIQNQNQLLEIQSRRLDEQEREFNKTFGEMQIWRRISRNGRRNSRLRLRSSMKKLLPG